MKKERKKEEKQQRQKRKKEKKVGRKKETGDSNFNLEQLTSVTTMS